MEGDGLVVVHSKEELPADALRFFETQVDFSRMNYFSITNSILKIPHGSRCFKMSPLSFCEINMDGAALVFFSSDGYVYYLFLGCYGYMNPEHLHDTKIPN
jgi:hypothetical protein